MLKIGVQTKTVINHENPAEGFEQVKKAGFSCVDFSLNEYLLNKTLYAKQLNTFFDKTGEELQEYFRLFKEYSKKTGIAVHQMHMPYPNYVPEASEELNAYLRDVVAIKSMQLCEYLDCKYIVIHGLKLAKYLGSEEAEWKMTEKFLDFLAPMAKEMGITMCVENIYISTGNHILEGPCCDAVKAAERIDRMNDKYGAEVLGFCFDTGHANLVGIDFERFIMTLGNRLKVLHIHDNDGIADLHQVPFTFTKTRENKPSTDLNGFVNALKAIKFDKVLSFETAPVLDSFPMEMREDALAFIAKIGRYFAEKIEDK